MTGFDAGRVRVRLTLTDDIVVAVDVACERPDVAAALRGRPADEAVQLVPLIYSLCGQAQGIAARLALTAARGAATARHVDGRVAAEALREHAWKLLVDWPKALGLAPDEALFVRVARTAPGTGDALAAELRAKPVFAGGGDALLAERIAVRGAELLALLEGRPTPAGSVAAEALDAGRGRATVMTARGELRHEIALDGERIAAYAIEAPTDRLFRADGPLPGLLLGLGKVMRSGIQGDGVAATAERLVMALDPCVPWELEID
jgi:uptake hydrogenase large subunit